MLNPVLFDSRECKSLLDLLRYLGLTSDDVYFVDTIICIGVLYPLLKTFIPLLLQLNLNIYIIMKTFDKPSLQKKLLIKINSTDLKKK